MFAVDVGFLHLRELGVILQRAELRGSLHPSRRLSQGTGCTEYLKSQVLVMVLLVKFLQFPVLRVNPHPVAVFTIRSTFPS